MSAPEFVLDDAQIRALRTEAGQHGDAAQVAICDRALSGDTEARRACFDAIAANSEAWTADVDAYGTAYLREVP